MMLLQALPEAFQEVVQILNPLISNQVGIAFAILVAGLIVARITKAIILHFKKNLQPESQSALQSFARLFELFIFIFAIIFALQYLQVDAAVAIVNNIVALMAPLVSLLLLLFLGFLFITLFVDILFGVLMRLGMEDYLEATGINKAFLSHGLNILKFLLFLIVLSGSLNYVGFSIPSIDLIVTAIVYIFVLLGSGLTFIAFKDIVANFVAGLFLERNVLKPGQRMKIGEYAGEVTTISSHGVVIKDPSGYNVMIPNQKVLQSMLAFKRARTDFSTLEAIRKSFVTQLPSFCGPASAAMMLEFFGYNTSQEELGKISETKTPGGTNAIKLIEAVKNVSHNAVIGGLVKYENIHHLKDEAKTWVNEGALLLVWYKKPVLFPDKQSQSGHYVLCVGVEDDELIIVDPSAQTAGVYLIDYQLLEEAMASEHDSKTRGYLVFAKKGTSAYWRINEKLLYTTPTSYKDLSKSFERYLLRLLRKARSVHDVISEPVLKYNREKAIRRLWTPEELATIEKEEAKDAQEEIKKEITKPKKESTKKKSGAQ